MKTNLLRSALSLHEVAPNVRPQAEIKRHFRAPSPSWKHSVLKVPIIATGHGKMDSETWKTLVYNFTQGFLPPSIWKSGLLLLDDLMVEGGRDKELLDLFTKHSTHQNITVLYLCQDMFPPGKYAKSISRNAPLCHSLQKSTRSIKDEEFTSLSFSDLLVRHDVYQKVPNDHTGTRPWIYIPPVITGNVCLVTSWRTKNTRAGIEELKKRMFDHWTKTIC